MTAETEDRVLTQVELAKRWNLTPRTLQNWFNEGKGPKRVIIGKPGYRLSDVLQYEADQAEEPGTRRDDKPKRTVSDKCQAAAKKSRSTKKDA
jgi:hypothetical protein